MDVNMSDVGEQLKDQGNELFKSKNYKEAISCYTKAIGIL